MTWYVVKVIVTTALIVAIAEVSKRSTVIGAVLASIPLVSVLAMIWLYFDTRDVAQVSALARSIFWLVLPSLALFLLLPVLLDRGHGFFVSLGASIVVTVLAYTVTLAILDRAGIQH